MSYNISVPIFGGFAPFFATLLILITGDRHAPSFYLMLTAAISLCALPIAPERSLVIPVVADKSRSA